MVFDGGMSSLCSCKELTINRHGANWSEKNCEVLKIFEIKCLK